MKKLTLTVFCSDCGKSQEFSASGSDIVGFLASKLQDEFSKSGWETVYALKDKAKKTDLYPGKVKTLCPSCSKKMRSLEMACKTNVEAN